MADIFFSYHHDDLADASEAAKAVASQTGLSVYLFQDETNGVRWGAEWERQLFAEMRMCEAVLIVHSAKWTASSWCFSEFVLAKATGKLILPFRIDDTQLHESLKPIAARSTAGPTDDFRCLKRLIDQIRRESDRVPLAGNKVEPYPGGCPFKGADAGFFFGRRDEILNGCEACREMLAEHTPGLLLLAGDSGSGKSSLMRAGLLPRLEREGWILIEQTLPWEEPKDAAPAKEDEQIASHRAGAESGHVKGAVVDALSPLATSDQRFVVVIDEIESAGDRLGDPWRELITSLASEVSRCNGRAQIAATVRSRWAEEARQLAEEAGLRVRDIHVKPMEAHHLAKAIREPAERIGIEVESDLLHTLVGDSQGSDALPLVAKALRKVWESTGENRRMTRAKYIESGGLAGIVKSIAESVMGFQQAPVELAATLSRLAALNQRNEFVRRRLPECEVPMELRRILSRLVDERLLVEMQDSSGVVFVAAHESIFRHWPYLNEQLEKRRDLLAWRRDVESRLERPADDAGRLLQGRLLEDGVKLAHQHAGELTESEQRLLRDSKWAESERLARAATSSTADIRARLRIATSALTWAPTPAAHRALRQSLEPRLRWFHNSSSRRSGGARIDPFWQHALIQDPTILRVLAVANGREQRHVPQRALRSRWICVSADGASVLRVRGAPGAEIVEIDSGRVSARLPGLSWLGLEFASLSPDLTHVATIGSRRVRLWRRNTERGNGGLYRKTSSPRTSLREPAWPWDPRWVDFSADSSRMLATSVDRAVVRDVHSGRVLLDQRKQGGFGHGSFDGDGQRVVTAGRDGWARIWGLEERMKPVELEHGGSVNQAVFSPDGASVATVGSDGYLCVWNSNTGERLRQSRVCESTSAPSHWAGRLGDLVVRTRRVWDRLEWHQPEGARGAQFSEGGRWILTYADDGTARLLDALDLEQILVIASSGASASDRREAMLFAQLSARGEVIVTTSETGMVCLWQVPALAGDDQLLQRAREAGACGG